MSFAQSDINFSDYLSDGEVTRLMQGAGHGGVDALPEFINEWEAASGNVAQTGTHVHTVAYPGDYDFRIGVEESSSRSSYVYSSQLNRLYIDMNKVAPVKFMWNGPATLHVRAMLIFKEPDFEKIAVSRCRMHMDVADPSNVGYNHPTHVLKCDDERAIYSENASSCRQSVISFLDHIPPGSDGLTVHYRLMCKTSCVGGINRRKTDLIFTLEDSNNHVVGRAILGVKVCSCPRRDKDKDETPTGKKRRSDCALNRTPNSGKIMKKEAEADNYDVYQVRVPSHLSLEFKNLVSRWLTGATLSDEAVQQATFGEIVKL